MGIPKNIYSGNRKTRKAKIKKIGGTYAELPEKVIQKN